MSDPRPTESPAPTPTPTPSPSQPGEQPATPVETPPASPAEKEPESVLGGPAATPAEPFDAEKITFPEGSSKDDPLFGDFKNIATEAGLTGPVAQKLIDLAARQTKAANATLLSQWEKQQQDWQTEIKADKEIGGDKLEQVLQTFSKVANDPELTDPEFRRAMTYTGAGNHPAIVRTLARWSKALAEGGPVRGNPPNRDAQGNAVAQRPLSIGEAFYPNGPHTGGPKIG